MRQNFKNYFEAQLFNTVHHATLKSIFCLTWRKNRKKTRWSRKGRQPQIGWRQGTNGQWWEGQDTLEDAKRPVRLNLESEGESRWKWAQRRSRWSEQASTHCHIFLFMPRTPENTETAMQYSKFVIIAYICYKKWKNGKVKLHYVIYTKIRRVLLLLRRKSY